jgi:hypothetical protein
MKTIIYTAGLIHQMVKKIYTFKNFIIINQLWDRQIQFPIGNDRAFDIIADD